MFFQESSIFVVLHVQWCHNLKDQMLEYITVIQYELNILNLTVRCQANYSSIFLKLYRAILNIYDMLGINN